MKRVEAGKKVSDNPPPSGIARRIEDTRSVDTVRFLNHRLRELGDDAIFRTNSHKSDLVHDGNAQICAKSAWRLALERIAMGAIAANGTQYAP